MLTAKEHSIAELADLAGVTPRTVRYYIAIGLLPAPGQAGPRATYGEAHLRRLRLIRRLQAQHLPLAEIGSRLANLDDAAVIEALESDVPSDAPDSALDYIRHLTGASRKAMPGGPDQMVRRIAEPITPRSIKEPPPAQRTQWERVSLGENVELHIRRPLSRLESKRVDRLIRIGKELLEEEES